MKCSINNEVSVALTSGGLLFVHQVEGISSWGLGLIQSLSYLCHRPAQALCVLYSFAGLHSDSLRKGK